MLVTVMDDVPLFPSLVAVIVAEPGVTPETSPEPLTVATAVLLLDQETVRPESAAPFASLGVAAGGADLPAWDLTAGGAKSPAAPGTLVTGVDAVAHFPPPLAAIMDEARGT